VRASRALLIALAVAGCHGKQELTAPPPPLRPEPQPTAQQKPVEKDCEPTDPQSELKPLSFGERSIPEGQRLADQGYSKLRAAASAEVDRTTREQQTAGAVEDFITALAADPYNVSATYGLAAAYAKIGRKQCSINLLQRLIQMRSHPSQHAEVEARIDHLLGRTQALDPDFADMRRDERFRALIAKMCEGTKDPNCVFGAERGR
jgi:hypothetical protein